MQRRGFLSGGLAAAFMSPLRVNAQQAGARRIKGMPRVGYLAEGAQGPGPDQRQFEGGLREHGYLPGTNVVIERRSADGRLERLADLAVELVRRPVDVIAAPSQRGAMAARQVTTVIPIVMVLGIDPVRQGLIDSLARPGGNVTGLTVDPGPEIIAKRLQLLLELVPRARAVGLLTEPPPPGRQSERFAPLDGVARATGVFLIRREVRRSEDLERALTAIKRAGGEALLVSGASLIYLSRREVSGLAMKHRLPAIYPLDVYVEAGGLISYGVDMLDLFRRAGGYVGRILKGARPGDLPVEQPTKFELVINGKTAKALGLTIPPSLLARADQVIE
jgi:putative ABC transport system substrate-binding protein